MTDMTRLLFEDYHANMPLPPKRKGEVYRFSPSPTGFLHIGGLFTALVNYTCARRSGGDFFVRIEDTDKKREVSDGVSQILKGLQGFGVGNSEGVLSDQSEAGEYGPYTQSKRKDIYSIYAAQLVEKGMAYPCFCSEQELAQMREQQESEKITTGYYGKWTKHRDITYDQAKSLIESGKSWVLRFKAPADQDQKIIIADLIKGKIEMPKNYQDFVILKKDKMPTYHFAHAVDDHLMGVTHVVRGDEWISSLPLHIALFEALEFTPPRYAHLSPIMKSEGGGKRKLSKRKDPEAAVSYYEKEGFPPQAVLEYLFTLANSSFEQWRTANPDADIFSFDFKLKNMSKSGALFDLAKLYDISKRVISRMSAQAVYEMVVEWAAVFDSDLHQLLTADQAKATSIFSIDRNGPKPRKDIGKWADVSEFLHYFYFPPKQTSFGELDPVPILTAYSEVYDPKDDNQQWFQKIRELCPALGFCSDVKVYKKNPAEYLGHAGDVATVIRIAVTGRTNTPDLCKIMQILGKQEIITRFERVINGR